MERDSEENQSTSDKSIDKGEESEPKADFSFQISPSKELLNINDFFGYDDSLKNYTILKNIGNGSFSTVYRARRIADGQIYAIKQMDKSFLKKVTS